jgi:uncharacterized phage protein gp47/JayE
MRFSVVGTLSDLCAGFSYLHYAYQNWIALQANPATATDEYCDLWGSLKGVDRKPATATVLTVTFSGINGTNIPNGTGLSQLNGVQYTTTTSATIASGTATVTAQAVAPGSAGNASVGTQMVLSTSITGINATSGLVATQTTPGADLETDAAYKTRYLQAYRQPPQGGALADYINWAEAVPGVTRAWAAPNAQGAGTLVIYVMLDDAESPHGGFPQGNNGVAGSETRDPTHIATGDQLAVANAIFTQQPVTALVYVCAPTNTPVNFTISGLGSANTAANQAAITAALQQMFLEQGQVGGTLNPDTMQPWPSINPSSWYLAVSSVIGLGQFIIGTPSSSLTPSAGQLLTLGTVTFAS